MENDRQVGWLLDDGLLCIGVDSCAKLNLVTYTDDNAIRFADRHSAETFRWVLSSLGLRSISERCKPVEHSWG